MINIVPYLSFLTSGIGILSILYLLLRFPRIPYVNGLVWIIFSLVFLEFYIYALTSKHIYQMLFLLRTPNIIRVFLPITLFLYVRGMLLPSNRLIGLQWLHFVFPLVLSLGILPDLFLSTKEKIAILDHYYQSNKYFISMPMGLIPAGIVQPVSILVGIFYGLYSLFFVCLTEKQQGAGYLYLNKQTLGWLKLLSGSVLIYFVLQLYQFINLFLNNAFDPPSQLIKCVLGMSLFAYFITSPNVQENMDGCILPKVKAIPTLDEVQPILLNDFIKDKEAVSFDLRMKAEKAFLIPDFDVAAMAKILDIPASKLSRQIKKYYGVSYVEYLNRLKIYYFLSQRSNFDQYTLETYIYKSGFTNRSTFYAAFKKYVGVNPSFYLKEISA